jgi:hypothetical protein
MYDHSFRKTAALDRAGTLCVGGRFMLCRIGSGRLYPGAAGVRVHCTLYSFGFLLSVD